MSITDLQTLLHNLSPALHPTHYVFCCVNEEEVFRCLQLRPFAIIQEPQDWTIIIDKSEADNANWTYQGVFQCITLNVHSSLEAVGLTAVVSSVLAERGISANVVAAHHHDHIFIPQHRADEALDLLLALQK